MRIGELLVQRGLVSEDDLACALADQRYVGKRICALLVWRGLVDVDAVARALADLHAVSAALTKHFDNRDRNLERMLPAHVARAHGALPLGRLRDGELVICVRDPKPHTQAALERVVHCSVLVTTACSHVLDPLIDAAYPNSPPSPVEFAEGTHRGVADEYDVDLTTGPIPTILATDLPQFALVDLDDAGVDKQFSVHLPRTTTLPAENPRTPVKK
jgi:hypothetical protein